jgi:hypothetical protein
MTIAKDTAVTIRHTDFNGTVKGAAINDDGVYLVLMEWVDVNGDLQSRYFEEDQLTV